MYKCTDFYRPDDEFGVAWDDPQLAIDWPTMDYTLSERDQHLPTLSESTHLPDYQAV